MFETVKKSVRRVTVIAALVLAVLCFVSLYLPWFTLNGESQSVMEAVKADPDFFTGLLPTIILLLLWVAVFFLTNHPKLTLVGALALLPIGATLVYAGQDRGLGTGFGTYIYFLAAIGFIVCAFATKKLKKASA